MENYDNISLVYILTNPSFPDYVKIGYTTNLTSRLQSLNDSSAVPFAFRVYAWYEIDEYSFDKKIHSLLDLFIINERSIDNVNGKKRTREFYKIKKEVAYQILLKIQDLRGEENKVHLVEEQDITDSEEKSRIDSLTYDIDTFLLDKEESIVNLYNIIVERMKTSIKNVSLKPTPNYIALKVDNKNICEFHFLRNKLLLHTKAPIDEKYNIGNKVPDTYRWTLNYKIYIEKIEQIDLIIDFLLNSYKENNQI